MRLRFVWRHRAGVAPTDGRRQGNCMIDYNSIIERYYKPGDDDYKLLVAHSRQVAELSKQLCERLVSRHCPVDEDFVYEAAMLHDIGMFKTNAPGIFCFGKEPYICHGIIGKKLLDSIGLYRHALVCERHTGAGLTAAEIESQHLPLPHRDMLPLSLEEKVVCYADKFYSKSHITTAKPIDKVREQLGKFGAGTLSRFDAMAELFGEPDYAALDGELRSGSAQTE